MTETKWTLPTPDGKTIYGVKNSTGQGAKAAIFMAHGLTSTMYDYAFKRAADYFSQHGYDVYRFNLYDGEQNGRKLTDCTLLTHAGDLNLVIGAFGGEYEKTFAVGHSYGGTTVMLANPAQLTAVSLWDPSYNISKMNADFSEYYGTCGPYITITWGVSYLLNPAMEEHASTLDEAACINLSKAFKAPIQVVFAGDGYYINQPLNYHSHGNPRNTSAVVAGTSHCFYEGDSCEDLLAKTHDWFKQF